MASAKTSGGRKRAASNRSAAARRTAQRAKNEKAGTEPPKKSVADHSEHPENPTDSTVRHTEPGFPQGEGDVTQPAKATAVDNRSTQQLLLDQHTEGPENAKDILDQSHKDARLNHDTFMAALETMPVGTVIEHIATNRWRVHYRNRFGFGSTGREAIESFVLGDQPGTQDARNFARLSPEQQKEIEDRDRAAAKRTGQDYEASAEYLARQEAIENAKAEREAGIGTTAIGTANTDGAARASARDEAGQKRGRAAEARSSSRESKSTTRASKRASSSKKGSKK